MLHLFVGRRILARVCSIDLFSTVFRVIYALKKDIFEVELAL